MEKSHQKTTPQIVKDNFVLIKGEFAPDEALEVTTHLITEKIQFHKLRIFSREIRFGYVDKSSLARIEELRLCKESINDLIQVAKNAEKKIKIDSSITIQII
ncbi:hypothetical protein [Cytophaga aurantiaca]|uniref:hypothetical protein n=1 Tax=Cytophaga aurantiaca TaxID=29530 RepID=UPI00035DAFC5|nr:hypothetical protein [Cytophaga aurantiaca]